MADPKGPGAPSPSLLACHVWGPSAKTLYDPSASGQVNQGDGPGAEGHKETRQARSARAFLPPPPTSRGTPVHPEH